MSRYAILCGKLDGIIIFQVDGSLGLGTEKFLKDEDKAAKHFRAKQGTNLSSITININGSKVTHNKDTTITMSQKDKIERITIPYNETSFIIQRAIIQYIGSNTMPDICANVQLLVPALLTHADYESNLYLLC